MVILYKSVHELYRGLSMIINCLSHTWFHEFYVLSVRFIWHPGYFKDWSVSHGIPYKSNLISGPLLHAYHSVSTDLLLLFEICGRACTTEIYRKQAYKRSPLMWCRLKKSESNRKKFIFKGPSVQFQLIVVYCDCFNCLTVIVINWSAIRE